MRRAYHNLTAKYNVYFNGKEAYKEGVNKTQEAYKEDFNDILPLFRYSQKESLSGCVADMDRAILKGAKLIKLHSITVKPKMPPGEKTAKDKEFLEKKDYCNWVDDAYMLMGKAAFYKQDYYTAGKNFDYLVNEFKNEPIRYDAMLWSVRTKIESGNLEDALLLLVKIKEDPKFPATLLYEYNLINTDALIKLKRYDEAIEKLLKVIESTKKKKNKVRYTFILAQLYQRVEDNKNASDNYSKVLALNPSYDLEFNARIQLATSFTDGSGNIEEIKKILTKLLRDDKNKEFRDQIYYAFANVSLIENNEPKALEYYKKSISSSVDNSHQKALSYMAIGKMYIKKENYIAAQPFYDSCMPLLKTTFHDFNTISNLSKNLNELADNYNKIVYQDSVQRVAKMSVKERNLLIADIIKEIIEDEEIKRQQAEQDQLNSMLYNNEVGMKAENLTGLWYFYNQQAVNQGKQEFVKRWGSRKLEDNWRRANRSETNWDESISDSTDVDADSLSAQKLSDRSMQYYLQNLPLTDSLMNVSNSIIEMSMFNMALVYMDKIQNHNKAIETFQDFVERFVDSRLLPMAYYYLHNLYVEENNNAKAAQYKNLLVSKFPESKFAKALINPNYIRELKAQIAKEEKVYKNAYRAYLKNDFKEVIALCNEAFESFKESDLLPQFAFLKAVAVGRLADASVLKAKLLAVKKEYPESDIIPLVDKVLEYIARDNIDEMLENQKEEDRVTQVQTNEVAQVVEEPEIYFFVEKDPHLYVIVANTEMIDINRLKFNIVNYNLDFFSNFDFKISDKRLSSKFAMITVEPLVESSQAMNYFQLINISDEIFDNIDKSGLEHFVISQKNFAAFVLDKRVERYLEFFYANY